MREIIQSIEKGQGENSFYFRVKDPYNSAILKNTISKIQEEKKTISWDTCGEDMKKILVYRGYNEKGDLLFEIESESSLCIVYENPELL